MTPHPLPPVRRVVTAVDSDGLSFIASDGAPQAVLKSPERPGYVNSNVWRTTGPATIDAPDETPQHRGVMPPPNGTVLRVIDYPPQPDDPQERRRQQEASFAAMYPDAGHQPDSARHPGMHITDTVDYAIVLEGEMTAILEKDETVLRAGDILIQRGTNHAWANTSGRMARIAFILVDARPTLTRE